jgi:hypothetical protein
MKCYSRLNVTLALLLLFSSGTWRPFTEVLDINVDFFTIKILIPSHLICRNFSARHFLLKSKQIRNSGYFFRIVFTKLLQSDTLVHLLLLTELYVTNLLTLFLMYRPHWPATVLHSVREGNWSVQEVAPPHPPLSHRQVSRTWEGWGAGAYLGFC